jgi:GDP/UDP-N,N'-diacetylbacillosamine 2-epimerase (hydrolysing)
MLHEFVSKNKHGYVFKSLGHENFLSLINQSDGLLGNSSSGIVEVASLKKAVINIGDRQSGREQSANIINCKPMKINIIKSIRRIYSTSFAKKLRNCKNIYYKSNPSNSITKKLLKINLSKIKIKKFQDI